MIDDTPARATFIVLAYNQQDVVREAVAAALGQDCRGLEVILSDDGSSDSTFAIMAEMAASYDGPHLVRLRRTSRNAGFISHLRSAIEEATADIVILAAGDDVSFADRAERVLIAFERNPETMAVLSEFDVIGGSRSATDETPQYIEATALDMVVGAGGVGKGATYAYRKACFRWPEPLRDQFRSEDRVLPLRAALLGRVFRYTRSLVHYRLAPDSMSETLLVQRDQASQRREHWKVTMETLRTARDEHRIGPLEYFQLISVWRLAMWSRLLASHARHSSSAPMAAAARALLLPLRAIQRLQQRAVITDG